MTIEPSTITSLDYDTIDSATNGRFSSPSTNLSGGIVTAYGVRGPPAEVTRFYLFIGTFGFSLNAFVIVVLLLYRPSRQSLSNLYVSFQCCVDASVAAFLFLTTLFKNDGRRRYSRYSLADELLCRLWFSHTTMWSMLVASNYMVVAMTVERYVALVHPIFHRTSFTKKRRYPAVTIGLALASGLYETTISVSTSGILDDGKCHVISLWSGEKTATYVGILTVVVEYFVPLLVIVVLYSRIAWTLHKRVATSPEEPKSGVYSVEGTRPASGPNGTTDPRDGDVKQGEGKGSEGFKPADSRDSTFVHARDNVLKTSVWIAAAFVVCWSMNQVYYFLYNLGLYVVDFEHPFYYVTVVMVFLQCCFNPVIYCVKLESFQRGVRHVIVDRLVGRPRK